MFRVEQIHQRPVLILWVTALSGCLLAACTFPRPATTMSAAGIGSTSSVSQLELTAPPSPAVMSSTWTPTVRTTLAPSPALTTTPTPDPYRDLTIDYLASRDYGGGELQIVDILQQTSLYTRYIVKYPSDDLDIYGFMNVPLGEGPFPVVIALHGYIDPEEYQTLDYTTDNADAIARAGYLVIHPNLRGYFPSESGPNLFRVGMAIDVLNLIAIVKEQAGEPGALELADAGFIGLWGHSMGGGITTRVITVSEDVDAAVLYGSMSGDEKRNFEAILGWSDGERGIEELSIPERDLEHISPIYYLERIQAPVSIHHGGSDELVPLDWSIEMCDRLQDLGKAVECFTYDGQPHTFYGDSEELFNRRVIAFYDRQWKEP
ncbi:MAG TPA: alpha/beta fold hydrolase [Anaerolineales bacterium]